MSKERELLKQVVEYMWVGDIVEEIKELLAQPEHNNTQYLLDQVARLTVENAMLKEKWLSQPEHNNTQ